LRNAEAQTCDHTWFSFSDGACSPCNGGACLLGVHYTPYGPGGVGTCTEYVPCTWACDCPAPVVYSPPPPPPVPATPFGGRLPSAWVTNFAFRRAPSNEII
jgi:hypothetical protein